MSRNQAAHAPFDGGLWAPHRRSLTAGLVLTVTLVAFEALAVGTIMPLVADELHGLDLYGWAFSGFFLGSLVGIVAAGREIDRSGLVRPLAVGLVLFGLGLIVVALAPTMEVLVAGRALQGFGGGAIPPVGYVAIARVYPDRLKPRMFATLSTAWVVPGLLGPAIAGIVAEQLGWRIVFAGLLPAIAISGAVTIASQRGAATPAAGDAPRPGPDRGRLLWAIAVATGAGMAIGVATAPTVPIAALLLVGGLALGIPALRRTTPAGTLTARPGVPAAVLLRGMLTFAFFGAQAFLPLALVRVRGLTTSQAGIALTVATLSWTAGSWIQAHRSASWGTVRLVRLGFVALTVGIAVLSTILVDAVPVPLGIAAWGLAGLGMGLAYASLSLIVLRLSEPPEQGRATSGLSLSDSLGTALGAGVGGAIVGRAVAAGMDARIGIGLAFGAAAIAGLGGLALVRRLRD